MASPFRKDQLNPAMRARYGMDSPPVAQVVGVLAVVLAFGIGLVFVGMNIGRDNVDARVLHWSPAAGHVTVEVEVSRPGGALTTCALRAQDRTYADVAYAVFDIPAGQTRTTVTYELRTLMEPYAVELIACAVGGAPVGIPPPQFPAGVVPPAQPWTAG